LKVRVDELPDVGRVIHFHKAQAWLASLTENDREITLARSVEVDLELIPEADSIKLTGHLRGALQLVCSRCLQDFILELDETIELTLLRYLSVDAPHEIDLRPEDLDTEFFDGVTIDVDLIVAEQIFLALPQKPLCKTNCEGICSGCGADLNREACRCEKIDRSSAFDALRSVKIEN
jgi:uncharacterized protein